MMKSYMKPVGRLVSVQVNENIATSVDINYGSGKVYYSLGENGEKFIHTSSIVASNTGNKEFDAFYDLIASYVHNCPSACRSE